MSPVRHHHSRGLGMTSPASRQRLVEELKQQGVTDQRVLDVIGRIARHEFVDEALKSEAYKNRPLPIGHAQTISQPGVVALMTEAVLGGVRRKRVLEVGTGSGYQTAVLAELVETVFTLERVKPLSEQARTRLHDLGYRNIHFAYADGCQGWAPHAPYDGIVVTAGTLAVPPALTEQLAPGGRLVIPVGLPGAQSLKLIERGPKGLVESVLATVSFVPLLAGKG